MSEDRPGPFSNWPNLDGAPNPAPPRLELIEAPLSKENDDMAKNGLEEFLGGSPANVLVKLFFISLVVGALLMWLDIRPLMILQGIQDFIRKIYDLGWDAIREIVNYVLAGAAIVVPAWFILRLLNMSSGTGRR